MVRWVPSVSLYRANLPARSKNFSSISIPYSVKTWMSCHFASKSARSSLNILASLSLTFLEMWAVIFFTLASSCR